MKRRSQQRKSVLHHSVVPEHCPCALDVGEFNAGNEVRRSGATPKILSRSWKIGIFHAVRESRGAILGRRAACVSREASGALPVGYVRPLRVLRSRQPPQSHSRASGESEFARSLAAPLALYKRAATTQFNCILCAR